MVYYTPGRNCRFNATSLVNHWFTDLGAGRSAFAGAAARPSVVAVAIALRGKIRNVKNFRASHYPKS